ncbi:hypothetical protein IAT38_001852 [Cryptococcus sp. DSM 104549]
MYWPTATTRLINTPAPLDDAPILHTRSSRKGNFFATLTERGLAVWDVRPTVMQAAVVRSSTSVERFGSNVDVFWAHDGRGLIVLTSTSHLLFYQLVPSSRPSYDFAGPSTPGPGEGDVVMGWELRSLGTAFVMGGCESVLPQSHSVLMTLRHPPSILSVPYPVPSELLSPPRSHFPPPPLDSASEAQIECDIWDFTSAKSWLVGDQPPIPTDMTYAKTPGLPAVYTMLAKDGRAYAVYLASHLAQAASGELQRTQLAQGPKYLGYPIHPAPVAPQGVAQRVEAVSLEDEVRGPEEVVDTALHAAINPRFGLVAVGLKR